jgi:6-phosphogluconolactonase
MSPSTTRPSAHHRFPRLEDASRALADALLAMTTTTTRARTFTLALAGGATPRYLYRLLADEYASVIPWATLEIFWGDERYVPPAHPDSNYAMANAMLLSRVPIPSRNVHRVPTDAPSPATAAQRYEEQIRRFFPGIPRQTFDLILLGMGADGHTASLFPQAPTLRECEKWVVPAAAPSPARIPCRITFTLPLINTARAVFFLVCGDRKQRVVNEIMADQARAWATYPAARVAPTERVAWFTVETTE